MISDPVAVFIVLAGVVYVAVQLDRRVKVFGALGSAMMSILLAMALSNAGLLPDRSLTYELRASTGVSVALVLILLSVDLRSVISAGPKMLVAFLIGAVGTAFGAISAALALSGVVGPETWKLAGQYTGTYTDWGCQLRVSRPHLRNQRRPLQRRDRRRRRGDRHLADCLLVDSRIAGAWSGGR